jgi:hypothetical protein
MARTKPENKAPINPDLPTLLVGAVSQAANVALPYPNEQEEAEIPNLFQFLSPMVVSDPRYKGDGKAPRVMREPLMLTSWDRRAGCWRVSLSDKVFNLAGSLGVGGLLAAMLDVERAMAAGKFPWSQKKIT